MQGLLFSIITCLITLSLAFLWGGWKGFLVALFLSLLEISLSFDNAIINAQILKKIDPIWRKRFLSYGIVIAVFGVRIFLPILLVSLIADLGFMETLLLAIKDPENYAKHLEDVHIPLSIFGGIFLWMVFLKFFLTRDREVLWLSPIERNTARFGKFRFIDIFFTLIVFLIVYTFIPMSHKNESLVAGLSAIVVFLLLRTCIDNLSKNQPKNQNLALFLYLEAMDASFSFDGVISAFAISKDLIIIFLGLTLGAVFVRSLTLLLVHKKTLQKYRYLEHGAHYAIGALSLLMLAGAIVPIPEIIPGVVSVSILFLSFIASYAYIRSNNQKL